MEVDTDNIEFYFEGYFTDRMKAFHLIFIRFNHTSIRPFSVQMFFSG